MSMDEGETDTEDRRSPPERPPTGASEEVYCWNCGETISARAEICPHCGVRQRRGGTFESLTSGNSPVIAALASFLFPGLGQIYNREIEKGLVLIVLFLISMASVVVLVGFVAAPAVWLYAIYDAYVTADGRGMEAAAPG